MYFFRQNRCRIVGINIYKWNIYISQTLENWSLDYIFNLSRRRRRKINMGSVRLPHVICPFLCWFLYVVVHHRERYLNMQFYFQSPPHICTATPPNKHIHPECITVALSHRQPLGDAPCVWRAAITANTTIQPPLRGDAELLSHA